MSFELKRKFIELKFQGVGNIHLKNSKFILPLFLTTF